MKLLQRTSRYQLALAVPMLIVGTAIGYALVSAIVTHQVDEQLGTQASNVIAQLQAGERHFSTSAPDELILVAPGQRVPTEVKDSVLLDVSENEMAPWRIARTTTTLPDGSTYVITLGRSLVETEDLVLGIALSMTALLALITLGNVLLNRRLSRKLWQPFHHTLRELQAFEVDGVHPPRLPATKVDEFAALNRALGSMMANMRADFTAQKRFTEQAAHELQTPLAILQGKLDQLIQSPNIGEEEAGVIDGLIQARARMGRTISNMLLLARIGNQQFPAEDLDWKRLFEEQMETLLELMQERAIRYTFHQEQTCRLRLHHLLAEVLVANLLRNAVLHNVKGGSIEVKLSANSFTITNTGPEPHVPPTELFARFAKGDPSSSST
ncbi:MAG TPA: histidine kinase dimerization/phospho-acceptor domain-containing protein, partial [Flavobacteriales bacterium]|nr:histidine kinase dimerization/phospho-acceptor domain-containing protein [Flavobacteriales bacterium]